MNKLTSKKTFLKVGLGIIFLGTLTIPQNAQATSFTLDWDTNSWTSGTTNNNYNLTSGSETGTVNIDFSKNGGDFASFSGSVTPVTSTTLNGSSSTEDSLHLQFDPSSDTQSVFMNTSFTGFSSSIQDVSFTIFDIDKSNDNPDNASNWQDRVIVTGFLNGIAVDPTFNIADSTKVLQTNTNTLDGIRNVGNDLDNGNVEVSFLGSIDSFILEFSQDPARSNDNPNSHGIGIGDIAFASESNISQAVPEPLTILGSLLALGIGTFFKSKVDSKS